LRGLPQLFGKFPYSREIRISTDIETAPVLLKPVNQ
jgi:hypothetical protein